MSLAPTTELEAVNTMLNALGEAPVNTLVNMASVDAISALSILRSVNREVQAQGWHFNKEVEYPLVPNQNGELSLPTNTIELDAVVPTIDVVQRGSRVYDRVNHTYQFSNTLKVDITFLLGFEEIPEAARNYITLRSARILQDRVLGSDSLHQMHREDEYQALTTLRLMESETADYNILSNIHMR